MTNSLAAAAAAAAVVTLLPRPSPSQVFGVIAVLIGVGIASLPAAAGSSGSSAAAAVAAVQPVYLLVCCASFVFYALATILKEQIFKDAAKRMGGRQLDVLVVNAYCSTAQVGVCVLGRGVAEGVHVCGCCTHNPCGELCVEALKGRFKNGPLLLLLVVCEN
jgi:drug/metabolite transporter (DMT)-like permease